MFWRYRYCHVPALTGRGYRLGRGYRVGRAISRQPASSRLVVAENKSRPEGGCRLIARPTYETQCEVGDR
jgi:hypothetical protein